MRKQKTKESNEVQEVWSGFGPMLGYTWRVIQKYQEDDFGPGAKYQVIEESPQNLSGRVVDIGVWDLKRYAMRVSPKTLHIDIYDKMTLADLLELDT